MLCARALLEIAFLVRNGLESIGCQRDILLSDQTKEDDHDSQTTPAVASNRSPKPTPTSPAGDTRKERRARGADAAPTSPQGGPAEGRQGGA